ncbi:response regulator [Labilibacter sediminis]|nr:response regulator [Labilibacter sediminis]
MNILIIDDSITTRNFLSNILKENGHEVTEAADGVEGLIKTNQIKPEMILLDLLMPNMDGFQVLRELKKNKISIPVIVLTADIQDDVKEECYELGAKYFLNKPFKANDIINSMNIVNQQS